ncbi:collagen alpha-2(I) chain [Symphalangus syndactylus]|uniref:collagen alpha-2(I) chain n=1 Tax=Symphalangus syndactylus TaxID=9590 RepID=UPI0030071AC0
MPRAGREGSSPNQFKTEAPLLWGFLRLEPGQGGPTVPGTGFLEEMLLPPVNLRAELVDSSGSYVPGVTEECDSGVGGAAVSDTEREETFLEHLLCAKPLLKVFMNRNRRDMREVCRTGLTPPGKKPAKFFPGLTCESEASGPGAVLTCGLTITLQGSRCFPTQQGERTQPTERIHKNELRLGSWLPESARGGRLFAGLTGRRGPWDQHRFRGGPSPAALRPGAATRPQLAGPTAAPSRGRECPALGGRPRREVPLQGRGAPDACAQGPSPGAGWSRTSGHRHPGRGPRVLGGPSSRRDPPGQPGNPPAERGARGRSKRVWPQVGRGTEPRAREKLPMVAGALARSPSARGAPCCSTLSLHQLGPSSRPPFASRPWPGHSRGDLPAAPRPSGRLAKTRPGEPAGRRLCVITSFAGIADARSRAAGRLSRA